MKFNMRTWADEVINSGKKKAFPLMPYLGLQLINKKILEAVKDGKVQSQCVQAVASRFPSIASVTIMDLSVECEAFGGAIRFVEDEVPTTIGAIVNDLNSAESLKVPDVGAGRTTEYLKASELSVGLISDRPVFGCNIGPFSMAARLCGMTEIMLKLRKEPDLVATVLDKCTEFLVKYAEAYKATGANGIVIAEPAAGLINMAQCDKFSSSYLSKIVSAVQDESFMIILHNCGNTQKLVPAMIATGAMGFHFGNAVDMKIIMPQVPAQLLAFGNIDPVLFRNGNSAEVKEKTTELLSAMIDYPNFVISSGCDIPPGLSLENIDAFFEAVDEYNK